MKQLIALLMIIIFVLSCSNKTETITGNNETKQEVFSKRTQHFTVELLYAEWTWEYQHQIYVCHIDNCIYVETNIEENNEEYIHVLSTDNNGNTYTSIYMQMNYFQKISVKSRQ